MRLVKISSDTKVKMLQATVWATVAVTLIGFWDTKYFLIGLVLGWFMWLFGVTSLHKYSSHKMFTPKNKAAEIFLHITGTLAALGSNISWAATHRKHHQHSDQPDDPHSIHNNGGGFWNGFKIYWYYFPTYHINPRTVKDLTVDPMHKWFHKHYYTVNAVAVAIIYLLGGWKAVGYFWALPVFYVHTGISYITVTAHCIWIRKYLGGYRNFEITDHTYNWLPASLLFPGEGNHNNHHALPGAVNNKMSPRDIDLGIWYVKLIGNISKSQDYYQKFVV